MLQRVRIDPQRGQRLIVRLDADQQRRLCQAVGRGEGSLLQSMGCEPRYKLPRRARLDGLGTATGVPPGVQVPLPIGPGVQRGQTSGIRKVGRAAV